MKTFTETTEQVRSRIIQNDEQELREQSAKNYLKRLYEFNVNSITELNEEDLSMFVRSLQVLEGR
jgi:hypothetical protein